MICIKIFSDNKKFKERRDIIKPKVSIIVPIFNMEFYLKRCIESIQQQSLENIEIILVNDGSTDNSLKICEKFKLTDNRIILIDKANSGVSSARNVGIDIAKGEYIGFVDPDDWIEKDMYENMYLTSKEQTSSVCICNYYTHVNDVPIPTSLEAIQKVFNKKEVLEQLIPSLIAPSSLNSSEKTIMGSVWRTLISKDLIIKNNIKFNENLPLMEDLLYLVEICMKTDRVCFDSSYNYHYFLHSNSAMQKYRPNFSILNKMVLEELNLILADEIQNPIISNRLNNRYINMKINSIVNEIKSDNKKSIFVKFEIISRICNEEKFNLLLKSLNLRTYKTRKKLVLYAMKKKNIAFIMVYYSLNEYIVIRKNRKKNKVKRMYKVE